MSAAKRADWMAPWATPGTPGTLIMSPSTKISGWPGSVRSLPTTTRPERSTSAPVASASSFPSSLACTPAAHTLHWEAMVSAVPSFCLRVTPSASTPVTKAFMRSSTPSFSRDLRALAPSFSPKGGSGADAPSTRTTRALVGSMLRNSPLRVLEASSRICPAISTPVGPAPTTTKVRRRSTTAGSVACSACSKAPKMRALSSRASSMVFMPGANTAKWSLPK